ARPGLPALLRLRGIRAAGVRPVRVLLALPAPRAGHPGTGRCARHRRAAPRGYRPAGSPLTGHRRRQVPVACDDEGMRIVRAESTPLFVSTRNGPCQVGRAPLEGSPPGGGGGVPAPGPGAVGGPRGATAP